MEAVAMIRDFLADLFGPLLRWLWPRLEGQGDDGQPTDPEGDDGGPA